MQLDYWIGKWNKGDTKFHRSEPHPALNKYFPQASGAALVPLCGKSLDMLWLAEKGWTVVGIEASELACRAFFAENGLKASEEKKGAFTVFSAGKITIWCGDFFAVRAEDLPPVAAVYDRASLIALPEDMRARYAAQMSKLAAGRGVKYLLVTAEYPQDAVEGPPFSVGEAEIRRLYGAAFKIEQLRSKEDTVMPAINAKFSGVPVREAVYMLESLAT